ncbi:MAG TPA: inorganic phosphate transporter [Candidatus Xenobia bacterium]
MSSWWAISMGVGGWLNSRPVAEKMSKDITRLSEGQGAVANGTTALLVILASAPGLPVSTTHVACGSIFGVGLHTTSVQWKTVKQIALAWVVTLPIGFVMSLVAFLLFRH